MKTSKSIIYNRAREKERINMDKRKTYLLGIDTETANGRATEDGKTDLTDSLVYDIGYVVTDKKGTVYEKGSFAIADIFLWKELMDSAYYKEKLPRYEQEIKDGSRKLVTIWTARKMLTALIEKYNIKAWYAHNARFDMNALNNTVRYLSGSKTRYFFPKMEIWDTLKMSRDVLKQRKTYTSFCDRYGFKTNHRPPQNQYKAETIYRYITQDETFEEQHVGLDDILIEAEILAYCFRSHKKMRKCLFEK